jgi:hypothetical protein
MTFWSSPEVQPARAKPAKNRRTSGHGDNLKQIRIEAIKPARKE